VREGPYDIDAAGDALADLMDRPDPPTAVMCGSDVLAVGALARARELGLDVPGDVSITGFDDLDMARLAVPGLTTVRVPHREMGQRAAEVLIGMVEDGAVGPSVRLDTKIIERGSLAAPS
jgi:LacI family transcriptional regulator